jgi:hypothetical protein
VRHVFQEEIEIVLVAIQIIPKYFLTVLHFNALLAAQMDIMSFIQIKHANPAILCVLPALVQLVLIV